MSTSVLGELAPAASGASAEVKRIIPAIASTNALIAAALVAEALKVATYCGPVLNNYMMYMGQQGVYTHTFPYQKKEDCMVCGGAKLTMKRPKSLWQLMSNTFVCFRAYALQCFEMILESLGPVGANPKSS